MPPVRSRPLTPAVLAWRARYYAFRHARDRVLGGRAVEAADILDGEHGTYVRDRFRSLGRRDRRFVAALALAREPSPLTDQRADVTVDDPLAGIRAEVAELEAAALRDPPPGFLATPATLAAKLVAAACIPPGARVLEPSAGSGRILDAIALAHPDADVDAWELAIPLRELLVVKRSLMRFDLVGSDFLCAPMINRPRYAAIVMVPPLADSADARHVLHAWDHYLAPSGRLVAILAAATLARPDRPSRRVQDLLAAHGSPEGTHVHGGYAGEAARIITLQRGADATA